MVLITKINNKILKKCNNEYINNSVSDTRDVTKSGSETLTGHKKTDDNSTNIIAGTKINVGDEAQGYTGAKAMLEKGISNFIIPGDGFDDKLMREAFIDNETKYLNSIVSKTGHEKAENSFQLAGELKVGMGARTPFMSAEVSAAVRYAGTNTSSTDTAADFNRMVVEQIVEQIDMNSWNGAYNDMNGNFDKDKYDKAMRHAMDNYENILENIRDGSGDGWDKTYDKPKERKNGE